MKKIKQLLEEAMYIRLLPRFPPLPILLGAIVLACMLAYLTSGKASATYGDEGYGYHSVSMSYGAAELGEDTVEYDEFTLRNYTNEKAVQVLYDYASYGSSESHMTITVLDPVNGDWTFESIEGMSIDTYNNGYITLTGDSAVKAAKEALMFQFNFSGEDVEVLFTTLARNMTFGTKVALECHLDTEDGMDNWSAVKLLGEREAYYYDTSGLSADVYEVRGGYYDCHIREYAPEVMARLLNEVDFNASLMERDPFAWTARFHHDMAA